jgi:hypothetical protein
VEGEGEEKREGVMEGEKLIDGDRDMEALNDRDFEADGENDIEGEREYVRVSDGVDVSENEVLVGVNDDRADAEIAGEVDRLVDPESEIGNVGD